jgi:hypothetical protein
VEFEPTISAGEGPATGTGEVSHLRI